jgi:3-hydroxymyristoyl/3-hydroxydecanoyl-(acyl carrier protein) dehydratase
MGRHGVLMASGGRRETRLAPNPCFLFSSLQIEGGQLRAGVVIPGDSPLFEGHYPGHPILPAIGHLALLAEALAEGHVKGSFAEVPALRLRHPVGPGESLDLAADLAAAEGTVRFALSRGREPVSLGTVRLARLLDGGTSPGKVRAEPDRHLASQAVLGHPTESGPADRHGTGGSADRGFPSPATLISHALPARLVESIVEAGEKKIVCEAAIPENHPLVRGGRAPGFAALEAAAQAAAVLEAWQRRGASSGPRVGYLVGIRDARFAGELPAGRLLRVTARLTASLLPLCRYDVGVELDGAERAAGTISTYLVEQPG